MELPIAMIIGVDQVRRQFDECAPDAPAIPHVEPVPRRRRARAALAGVLNRMADAVAPPEPVCH